MALKFDVGVVRDSASSVAATPVITDIGVPTNYALVTADNTPQGPVHSRADVNPAGRSVASRGVGVPYNPVDGNTVD